MGGMMSCGFSAQVQPIGYAETDDLPDVLKVQFIPPIPKLDPENKWLPLLTPAQLVEIQTAFKRFDKDGDGHVEPKEIQRIMKDVGVDLPPSEVQKLIASVDDDGSGTVEFDEFVGILASNMIEHDGRAELETAFGLFDQGKTGYLDVQHARALLCNAGSRPLRADEVDALLSELQTDATGRIPMQSFMDMQCWDIPAARKNVLIASVVEDVSSTAGGAGGAGPDSLGPPRASQPPSSLPPSAPGSVPGSAEGGRSDNGSDGSGSGSISSGLVARPLGSAPPATDVHDRMQSPATDP
uniref:EF-hand domain-containing protein n=1 Tax=Haptolina brevifila TaxID=156173 RepID=A0A7S2N8K9_9EUKA|mmetsp:Transcript_69723/g.138241  ORF Transcript_69723/g.138241 Transcript_69723/m.138241 type:complete len:297 (+) Transcript_69723:111-1001(+)|eukprot:CAMPEP_0174718182 /NCGR_PEP_ID=MMETSP1094-20130205/28234_1 /TAXON_ID=156173 /ORGANISM="Chrysochromulina brevifilum, Strain UTEX LB 985" /LENGTH=296 /DNA_ID=CAMNT_0015918233 /DNA_START=82 /DNA_END=972 /DNA_ORIENTATION=+